MVISFGVVLAGCFNEIWLNHDVDDQEAADKQSDENVIKLFVRTYNFACFFWYFVVGNYVRLSYAYFKWIFEIICSASPTMLHNIGLLWTRTKSIRSC